MASQNFYALERTLRRMYWIDFVDRHLQDAGGKPFRASLVVNPRSGLPLGGATVMGRERASASSGASIAA